MLKLNDKQLNSARSRQFPNLLTWHCQGVLGGVRAVKVDHSKVLLMETTSHKLISQLISSVVSENDSLRFHLFQCLKSSTILIFSCEITQQIFLNEQSDTEIYFIAFPFQKNLLMLQFRLLTEKSPRSFGSLEKSVCDQSQLNPKTNRSRL